jgi:ATP-dependent helicase/nuclease subunit A
MSSKLPAKLSVTELKRMSVTSLDDEYTQNIFVPPIIKKPSFLEGKGKISAAEKGTIMHLVMQHIDAVKPPCIEDVKHLMDDMVSMEFMTQEQRETVDIGRIVSFFESPLGGRLIKSRKVNREVPFYMEIQSIEVYKDLPQERYSDEKIVLQGIIDCYFEEDDGLVLIDYKTDYVPDGRSDDIKEKYRVQVEYYTRALERLTGKNVKEKYIYLFYNGEILGY